MSVENIDEQNVFEVPLFTAAEQDYWSRVRDIPRLPEFLTRLLAHQVQISKAASEELAELTETPAGEVDPGHIEELRKEAGRGLQARNRLCEHNLLMVPHLARKLVPVAFPELEASDLIQEGNISLLKSIQSYDPEQGSLYNYAAQGVRQRMGRRMKETKSSMRLPTGRANEYYNLHKFADYLHEDLGREPTAEEIAAESKIDTNEVRIFQRHQRGFASLEGDYPELLMAYPDQAEIEEDPQEAKRLQTLEEYVIDRDEEDFLSTLIASVEMEGVMSEELDEREQEIVRRRYGYDGDLPTLEAIGKEVGLTRERVRQLEARALSKLKRRYYLGQYKEPPVRPRPIRRFNPAWAVEEPASEEAADTIPMPPQESQDVMPESHEESFSPEHMTKIYRELMSIRSIDEELGKLSPDLAEAQEDSRTWLAQLRDLTENNQLSTKGHGTTESTRCLADSYDADLSRLLRDLAMRQLSEIDDAANAQALAADFADTFGRTVGYIIRSSAKAKRYRLMDKEFADLEHNQQLAVISQVFSAYQAINDLRFGAAERSPADLTPEESIYFNANRFSSNRGQFHKYHASAKYSREKYEQIVSDYVDIEPAFLHRALTIHGPGTVMEHLEARRAGVSLYIYRGQQKVASEAARAAEADLNKHNTPNYVPPAEKPEFKQTPDINSVVAKTWSERLGVSGEHVSGNLQFWQGILAEPHMAKLTDFFTASGDIPPWEYRDLEQEYELLGRRFLAVSSFLQTDRVYLLTGLLVAATTAGAKQSVKTINLLLQHEVEL